MTLDESSLSSKYNSNMDNKLALEVQINKALAEIDQMDDEE